MHCLEKKKERERESLAKKIQIISGRILCSSKIITCVKFLININDKIKYRKFFADNVIKIKARYTTEQVSCSGNKRNLSRTDNDLEI